MLSVYVVAAAVAKLIGLKFHANTFWVCGEGNLQNHNMFVEAVA